jgi:hypothetical protein
VLVISQLNIAYKTCFELRDVNQTAFLLQYHKTAKISMLFTIPGNHPDFTSLLFYIWIKFKNFLLIFLDPVLVFKFFIMSSSYKPISGDYVILFYKAFLLLAIKSFTVTFKSLAIFSTIP